MVNFAHVRTSNSNFQAKSSGLVAIFVGGTSGVGKGILKKLVEYASGSHIYVVGRSESSAAPLLNEVRASNIYGTLDFIETEISLIKNVDHVSERIKQKETKVDLIFLSTGYLTVEGRKGTDGSRGRRPPYPLCSPLTIITTLTP